MQDQRVYQGQCYVDEDVGHHPVVAGMEEASFPPVKYDWMHFTVKFLRVQSLLSQGGDQEEPPVSHGVQLVDVVYCHCQREVSRPDAEQQSSRLAHCT